MFFLLLLATGSASEFHVDALRGELGAPGTLARPFPSVHAARDALRELRRPRGAHAVVHVHGASTLLKPLTLDERDSHTTWSGVGDAARLSGGTTVPFAAFLPADVPSGAAGVVKASLFQLGFNATGLGKMASPHPELKAELFVDGRPMTLARDPSIAANGTWLWHGYEAVVATNASSSFTLRDDATSSRLAKALGKGDGLWLHGYWKFDWRDTFVKIDAIARAASAASALGAVASTATSSDSVFTINAQTPPQYPPAKGCRFVAVDSLEFLDAPNEYYIDPQDGTLYFLPAAPLSAASRVVVSRLISVVDSVSTAGVTFDSLTISDARGDVVRGHNAIAMRVVNATVSNGGGACIAIDGVNSSVRGSSVFGCGSRGISITCGDVATLMRGGCDIVGNDITRVSRITRTYTPGVGFSGVGHYIANNSVSDAPHTAMEGSCNDCMFEHNTVTHACYECTDTGAFYVGRSWSQRGNVARYNTFKTIRPTERLAQKSCSQNAFYLDDQMSGWEFYGNTIINATTGVLLGGGRRNKIYDNFFLNNDNDVHFDARGLSWQTDYCAANCSGGRTPKGETNPACFRRALESLKYTRPPYSTAYGGVLPHIFAVASDPCVPVDNVIANNTYCHARSVGGGKFIDATAAEVNAWRSTLEGNVEDCHPHHAATLQP